MFGRLGGVLSRFLVVLEGPRGVLRGLGVDVWSFGGCLESIFGRFGGSEGCLERSFGGLERSWAALGRSWVALGPLLACLGWLLARLGALLARLGPLLAALGAV